MCENCGIIHYYSTKCSYTFFIILRNHIKINYGEIYNGITIAIKIPLATEYYDRFETGKSGAP